MVQAGTLFEYLAAFITIVLGLALADLLVSLHRLLRERRRIIWRPLPLLLALFVFLGLLTFFFSVWDMTRWKEITYFGLLWQMVGTVPIFLAACAVLPDDVPKGRLDLDQFYFDERRYVLWLIAAGTMIGIVDVTFTGWDSLQGDPSIYVIYYLINFVMLAAMGAMVSSERKWVHWLSMAIIFSLAGYGFAEWEISGSPAFVPRP
jgi:hypothetical protein